jgi:hypothetical protein
MKQTLFNVIRFVESKKYGCVIPLYNVNQRLESMLGISMSSVDRLKREFREDEHRIADEERKAIEAVEEQENKERDLAIRLRHPRVSRETRRFSPMARNVERAIPKAQAPRQFWPPSNISLSTRTREH